MDYRSSGVDIDAGNDVVCRIRSLARDTFTPGVLSDIGSFGGLFALGEDERGPVLVASADGVGTKLKVAFMTGRHDTIGEDLVNHCVNDILVQGAEPLFFLDYLATGRLEPDIAVQVVTGIARACRANGCALLGGETAEMPGFYADGEYDLAGFIVGRVERARLVDGRTIVPGDLLVGVPSSGLHTNGYSLARRIVFDERRLDAGSYVHALGMSMGDALLVPHRSYLALVRPLLNGDLVKGMAHVTGGGLTENVPRMLPSGCGVTIDPASWDVPPLFRWIQENGGVSDEEMRRAFNMGIGLVIAVPERRAVDAIDILNAGGEPGARVIGRVNAGSGVIYE